MFTVDVKQQCNNNNNLSESTMVVYFLWFQVSIDFDRTKAQPHENVSVIVTADPASTVNLLAVDQSVLLMKSGNDITSSQVSLFCSYDKVQLTHNCSHIYLLLAYLETQQLVGYQ